MISSILLHVVHDLQKANSDNYQVMSKIENKLRDYQNQAQDHPTQVNYWCGGALY